MFHPIFLVVQVISPSISIVLITLACIVNFLSAGCGSERRFRADDEDNDEKIQSIFIDRILILGKGF